MLGVVVLGVGLLDVFATVLQYEHVGLVAPRLYRLVWGLVRRTSMMLPARPRAAIRAVTGPALIPLTLVLWLGALLLGFALVYYPGVGGHAFHLRAPLKASFGAPLYVRSAT